MILGSSDCKERHTRWLSVSGYLTLISIYISPPKNLHFVCHMPRLTSVHVNIFSILKSGDMHKRHACAMHRDTQPKRGRRRANIPTSWQKLTQAQMYLTNSPLLCMFKCEPDGSEQWGLARCLIVCGGYRRGTLELIRVEAQAFCRKAPKSLCHSPWYSDLILSSTRSCPRMESH